MADSAHSKSSHRHGRHPVRIGFVPLIDAAPVIVARELGFFHDEGLAVSLDRQVGWANVRDKLTAGQLDASHALLGMPIASQLGRDWFSEPLIAVMSLSSGGNAITVSSQLFNRGVNSAAQLARYVRDPHRDRSKPLVFAHVFGCSMHHYLLRDWLAAAGVDPDSDVRMCVLPPPQMPLHLHRHQIDGFCSGEPWSTLSVQRGTGRIIAPTADIMPSHPEKIFAVTRRWAERHGSALVPMIRALLRACTYCSNAANASDLATMLAGRQYLDIPSEVVLASLMLNRDMGLVNKGAAARTVRPLDWQMRSFANTFPSRTHLAWMLEEMIRWGHAEALTDVTAVADACTDSSYYREAAASLNVRCPDDEYPPMALRGGQTFRVTEMALPN